MIKYVCDGCGTDITKKHDRGVKVERESGHSGGFPLVSGTWDLCVNCSILACAIVRDIQDVGKHDESMTAVEYAYGRARSVAPDAAESPHITRGATDAKRPATA